MTPRAGENLAKGHATPEQATLAWYNEMAIFDYNGTEYYGQPGFFVGHYTAMIWKSTKKLGCAWLDGHYDNILPNFYKILTKSDQILTMYVKNH